MTNKQIIESLVVLESVYSNMKVVENPIAFEIWEKILMNFSAVEVKQAVEMILENEIYPPTPAVMKKYIDMLAGNNSNEIVRLFQSSLTKFGSYRIIEAYDWIKSQSTIGYKVIQSIGLGRLYKMDQIKANQEIHKVFRDTRVEMSDNVKAIKAKNSENVQLSLGFQGRSWPD